ncbi:hypothetical protein EVAR_16885_1 [Eumeta japonica]|uniref:Uncharacterized protein n=1 Tax=Eumeta variegata TaxID=151549 RepID=A0A4C1V1Q8_EUMVA|nr:hypothetical protein EVAR_16885_1 [Eumeta japonica]
MRNGLLDGRVYAVGYPAPSIRRGTADDDLWDALNRDYLSSIAHTAGRVLLIRGGAPEIVSALIISRRLDAPALGKEVAGLPNSGRPLSRIIQFSTVQRTKLCRSDLAANDILRRYYASPSFLFLPRVPTLHNCNAFATNFTAAEFRAL